MMQETILRYQQRSAETCADVTLVGEFYLSFLLFYYNNTAKIAFSIHITKVNQKKEIRNKYKTNMQIKTLQIHIQISTLTLYVFYICVFTFKHYTFQKILETPYLL